MVKHVIVAEFILAIELCIPETRTNDHTTLYQRVVEDSKLEILPTQYTAFCAMLPVQQQQAGTTEQV